MKQIKNPASRTNKCARFNNGPAVNFMLGNFRLFYEEMNIWGWTNKGIELTLALYL